MLKDYKEEAETALKRCLEINENIVDNYISDPERQEFEEEEQEIYREELRVVVGKLRKHLKGRRHEESSDEEETLAMSNRKKWQAKPVAGENAKGKEPEKYLLDREEDLFQNVQSLAINQKEISVQDLFS